MKTEAYHLETAVDHFLEYLDQRKNRSESTIDTYRRVLMRFVIYSRNSLVSDVSVQLVDDYAQELFKYKLKPKSIKNMLTPIRSLFAYLYMKSLIDIRPEQIDLPSLVDQEANFLSHEEQEQLLSVCADARDKALVLCLLRSGLRISELIRAETDDIYNKSLVVRKGKGGKNRVTFLTQDAIDAIEEYHATMPSQRYLFPNSHGQTMSRQYIARRVSALGVAAKIKKPVTCHTLRHSFATNLLVRGARAEDVQPMMGHKNIRTTMIYMHFTNNYLHKRYHEIMALPVESY